MASYSDKLFEKYLTTEPKENKHNGESIQGPEGKATTNHLRWQSTYDHTHFEWLYFYLDLRYSIFAFQYFINNS